MKNDITLADWKRVVDELAEHGITALLLRGGEPLLMPGIIELLEYIHSKGMFISIDTNGTMLERYAGDIVRIGNIHLTISVDGPEPIHDAVRGVPGTFQRIKKGLTLLAQMEASSINKINRSICFTISRYNYQYLGEMPEVARSLKIATIAIVPYYYFPGSIVQKYTDELDSLDCRCFSSAGFQHEDSGVDLEEFQRQFHRYLANLGDIFSYPYMPLDELQYRTWFLDAVTPIGPKHCINIEKLIDIQPDGSVNFCVDFVDYSFGNIREASLEELWNNPRAEQFRQYRRSYPLAVCHRCGAKFMSQPWKDYDCVPDWE